MIRPRTWLKTVRGDVFGVEKIDGVRVVASCGVPFGSPRPAGALDRERRYTGWGDPRQPGGRIDPSALPCLCWCEAEIVKVTAEDVRAGRTGSCGRPACRAPEKAVA